MALVPLRTAAREIGVPYRSVYHHMQKKRIPTQKIGAYHCIEPAVLASVLSALGYQKRGQTRR